MDVESLVIIIIISIKRGMEDHDGGYLCIMNLKVTERGGRIPLFVRLSQALLNVLLEFDIFRQTISEIF